MIRFACLVLFALSLISCAPARHALYIDPQQDLLEATADPTPHKIFRRDAGGGGTLGPTEVNQLRVAGSGDTQFLSARADVPTVLPLAPTYQFIGRGTMSNHIELVLSNARTTVIDEPLGYPPGSELKIWAKQDERGLNEMRWGPVFVDHSGRGLDPVNIEPGSIDFYHFYLRADGVWSLEVHR
jgi:hypothetical protein